MSKCQFTIYRRESWRQSQAERDREEDSGDEVEMRSAATLATFSAAAIIVIAALSCRIDTPWMDESSSSSSLLSFNTNSKKSPHQRDLARLRQDALFLEKMSSARRFRSGDYAGTMVSLPRVRPEARLVDVLPERDATGMIVGQRRGRGRNRGKPMSAGAIRGTRRMGRLGIGLGGGGSRPSGREGYVP